MNVSGTWHKPVLLQRCLWGTGAAAPRTPTLVARAVCLTMKPVGEPYAGNPHVRFDERGWETERCRMAQATAPILDSTSTSFAAAHQFGGYWRMSGHITDIVDP